MTPINFNPNQKSYPLQGSSSEEKQQQALQTEKQSANDTQKIPDQKKEILRELQKTEEAKKEKQQAKEKQERQIEQLKEATNELLSRMNIALDFKVDEGTDQMVVKVKNKETNEVIRQIPPEEMLELAKRMEEMSGMLLDKWS